MNKINIIDWVGEQNVRLCITYRKESHFQAGIVGLKPIEESLFGNSYAESADTINGAINNLCKYLSNKVFKDLFTETECTIPTLYYDTTLPYSKKIN